MFIRKLLSGFPAVLALILILHGICFSSSSEITSISQLNNPNYRVGTDLSGPVYDRVIESLPDVEVLKFNNFLTEYLALQNGKIDALTCNEPEFITAMRNGVEKVRILPGALGTPIPIAAGISERSEIPGLKEKFNAFIAELKADGTLSAMYKRWVYDGETKIPEIDVPEKSDIHLTIGTTGTVMPFSFYINSTVTGFDIELSRRFAAHIGAEIEFKVYDFSSILMALRNGNIDIALSNLYATAERGENVIFSDNIFTVNCIVVVRDEGKSPVSINFETFRGKRIGVFTGSVQHNMVKNAIPEAKILYFDSIANIVTSLTAGKIDAAAVDLTLASEVERTNPGLTHTKETIGKAENAFLFPKSIKNNPLLDEFNEYLRRIKSDGTLDEIRAIWSGNDESKKIIPDYSDFSGTKGTIRIAAEGETPLFSYMKDGKIAGYDVDIILRFCREKGYRPDFNIVNFPAVIPAVHSGKCDIGIGGITITPERAESVKFSEPSFSIDSVLMILKPETASSVSNIQERSPKYKTVAELDGKTIGVQIGIDEWARIVKELLPKSPILYYNTFADIVVALKTHKIEAFIVDEPVFRLMAAEDENLAVIDEKIGNDYDVAFGFPKTEKGAKLCDEMSAFIRSIKNSGELEKIISVWEGADESKKTLPDFRNFPAHNGVLSMASEGGYPPFNYFRRNEFAGFEIDLAARFCEAYGYGLKITSIAYDSVIPALVSGRYDFSANLAPADERDTVYFSEPYCRSRSVMACLRASDPLAHSVRKLSDFDGKPIGMQPGIIDWEQWVAENLPNSKVLYYSAYPDLASALKTHKIEGFLVDSPVLALMAAEDSSLTSVDEHIGKSFGYSFVYAKTEAGKKLCDEMSEYLRKIKASGELDAILSKWQGADETAKIPPDFKSLPAKNGTISFAAEGSYPPFTYYKGTKLAGIDIDLAVRFCEAYGYGLDVQSMIFDAMLPAIHSGKIDFTGDFTPSEEHEEAVYYSEPYCMAYSVMACLKTEDSHVQAGAMDSEQQKDSPKTEAAVTPSQPQNNKPLFWEDITSSFRKTFIREDRWKLFAEGIMNTMIITVSSIFFGMLLGFIVFMFCRTGSRIANKITKFSVWLIKGTPIIVLLMILYYIIFGHVNISGIIVSIIAFTLTFGTSVYRMLTFGTGAVDRGQTEAAYALGFTDMQTFFIVILPQAALHFMPSFKEEVTMLIKSTSVVGYIAVQDLTKMGDIVRSRTYEAFFPLIAVAVIYFVLAGLLNIIVNIIHVRITPSKRKPEDILRGIDTARGNVNHD